MLRPIKPPRDEEAERKERLRKEKLSAIALHMLEAAVQRHEDEMAIGHYEMAGNHAETAAYWWDMASGGTSS